MTDNPYAVLDHRQAQRILRSMDRSRYGQVRLTITRASGDIGHVSVVVRSVGGGLLRDTRIHAGVVRLPPGSQESIEPIAALKAALAALENKPEP